MDRFNLRVLTFDGVEVLDVAVFSCTRLEAGFQSRLWGRGVADETARDIEYRWEYRWEYRRGVPSGGLIPH